MRGGEVSVERRRGVGWLGGEMKAKGMLTFGAINRVSTRLSRSEAVAIALRRHLLKI